MNESKINDAVERCLEFTANAEDRICGIADFLANLRMEGHWTRRELAAVRTGVSRRLIHRLRQSACIAQPTR